MVGPQKTQVLWPLFLLIEGVVLKKFQVTICRSLTSKQDVRGKELIDNPGLCTGPIARFRNGIIIRRNCKGATKGFGKEQNPKILVFCSNTRIGKESALEYKKYLSEKGIEVIISFNDELNERHLGEELENLTPHQLREKFPDMPYKEDQAGLETFSSWVDRTLNFLGRISLGIQYNRLSEFDAAILIADEEFLLGLCCSIESKGNSDKSLLIYSYLSKQGVRLSNRQRISFTFTYSLKPDEFNFPKIEACPHLLRRALRDSPKLSHPSVVPGALLP